MSAKLGFLTLIGIVLMLAVPLSAHHPFSAEYDWKKPVTVSGTVTKVDWSNPHAHLYVDVKDNSGRAQNWTFELGGIGALSKGGWKKDTIKTGENITIDAWMSTSKSNMANVKSVKLPNGRELWGASSIGEPMPISQAKKSD